MRTYFLAGLLALLACAAQAQSRADWWYDLGRAGTSLNIAQQENTFFVAWYRYDENSNPTWVYGSGSLNGNTVPLTLYAARGIFLGAPASVVSTPVGTASLSFANMNSAQFRYSVNGASGVLDLTRFSFQPIGGSGEYAGALVGTVNGCASEFDNGNWRDQVTIVADASSGVLASLTFNFVAQPMVLSCTFSGKFEQAGSRYRATDGSIHCNNGDWGSWDSENILFDNDTLSGQMAFVMDGSCSFKGRFAGVRLKNY